MPRGYPDYQNPVNQVAGRLVDFSSIVAAQLGIASLDGLGRMVWYDTFHNGMGAWEVSHGGSGVDATIDTSIAEIAPSSLVLTPGGVPAGSFSEAHRAVNYAVHDSIGVEYSMRYSSSEDELLFNLLAFLSDKSLGVGIYFYCKTGQIIYSYGLGTKTLVTLPRPYLGYPWIQVKIVLDFKKGVAERMIIGNTNYDVSDLVIGSSPSAYMETVNLQFVALSLSATSEPQHVGHVYFTTDEP